MSLGMLSAIALAVLPSLTGCAGEGSLSGYASGSAPAATPAPIPVSPPPAATPPSAPPATGQAAPLPPPPETEVRQDFEVPRGGARFVYVANRRRDNVSVIDSTGLGIRTVTVGDSPGYLATVPGQDIALVINTGSKDVSILRTDVAGMSTVSRVPVVGAANRISVGRQGLHAIAWYDSAAPGAGGLGAGGGFQEVSVISLTPGADKAVDLTVGFRPSDVVFADDTQGAYVVTEDGISIIRFADITGPSVAPFVRFPDAGLGAPAALDVSVTPDGRYAIGRREDGNQIMLLDLQATAGAAGAVISLDLGSPVTDLDLAPSGAFALAILRSENAYVRVAIPGGFAAAPLPTNRF